MRTVAAEHGTVQATTNLLQAGPLDATQVQGRQCTEQRTVTTQVYHCGQNTRADLLVRGAGVSTGNGDGSAIECFEVSGRRGRACTRQDVTTSGCV
jgi:hypothetical protein